MNVRLQSNGNYWQAAWSVPGRSRPKVKSLGNKAEITERKAKQLCRELERKFAQQPGMAGAAGKAPTLAAWEDRYFTTRTELAEGTVILHRSTFAYLRSFFGDDRRLDRISRAEAADWRAWLAKQTYRKGPAPAEGRPDERPERSLTETAICIHIRNAKTIFNRAMAIDLIGMNPFDRENGIPAEPEKDWQHLDESDINALIAAAKGRWKGLIALCSLAGLRRGEAMRLTWEDVHWESARLTATNLKTGRRTRKRTREVLMVPELEQILLALFEAGHKYPAKVSAHNLHRNMNAIITRAGMEPWHKPFHTLRKWRATSWRSVYPEHVVDAWLGHGLEVARRHYTAVDEKYYGPHRSQAVALADRITSLPEHVQERILSRLARLLDAAERVPQSATIQA